MSTTAVGPVAIGVDVGTQGVRVVVARADGTVVARAGTGWALHRGADGRHEQDPAVWWSTLLDVLREVAPHVRGDVLGLAVTSTSGTLVLTDRAGNPLRPAVVWDDTRAVVEAQELAADAAGLEAATGLRLRPSFPLAKLAWLERHEPQVLDAAVHLVHESDWLLHRLGGWHGRPATDPTNALKTGYDPVACAWLPVLAERGWAHRLPHVHPAGTTVGHLAPDVAAATGLPAGLPLVLGMTDANTATLAAGVSRPGHWVSTLGTGLSVKAMATAPVGAPEVGVYSHAHPSGAWLASGTSHTGGGVVTQTFGADQDELLALARAAEDVPVGRCLEWPLVGEGEFFPFWAPRAHGFRVGEPAGPAERFRAMIEGVAVVERLAVQALRDHGAPPVERLVALGGSTRSPLWNRVRASVQGVPLTVLPRTETAVGAALTVVAGVEGDFEGVGDRVVRDARVVEPEAALVAPYAELVARFEEELRARGHLPAAG